MYWIIVCAALLPVLLLFIYIKAQDVRQPEPRKWLFKALFFGVLSALTVIAVVSPLPDITVTSWWTACKCAFLRAAIPEESAKLLFLWLLLRKNPYYDERLDGIVYASCIGLGFAGLENIEYLFMSYMSDGSWLSTGVSRALFAVPGHFFFGVIMGFFYAKATIGNVNRRRWNLFLAWAVPVFAHGLYDTILMGVSTVNNFIAVVIMIVFVLGFNKFRKDSIGLIKKHKQEDLTIEG